MKYRSNVAVFLKTSLSLKINEYIGSNILTKETVNCSWTKRVIMSLIYGDNASITVLFFCFYKFRWFC